MKKRKKYHIRKKRLELDERIVVKNQQVVSQYALDENDILKKKKFHNEKSHLNQRAISNSNDKNPKKPLSITDTVILQKNLNSNIKNEKDITQNQLNEDELEKEKITTIVNNTKPKKSKIKVKYILTFSIFIVGLSIYFYYNYAQNKLQEQQKRNEEILITTIKSHFGNNVKVTSEAELYIFDQINNLYINDGIIHQNVELVLQETVIDKNTQYFYIPSLDRYIEYQDVTPISKTSVHDNRYKQYIPFNKNVVTNESFTLYENNNKVYTFNSSMSFPIIINDDGKYYVEFNNQFLYILKEDVKEIINNINTTKQNTSGIAVLNYHFIYDSNTNCNQSICLSEKKFEQHLKYIKEENVFTPTMHEFELYLDKKLQLPKSVLLTFDDGWLRQTAIPILDKYEVNATFFLVTSWYLPIESEYVEYHSHTHNMHNQGDCPTGQGGGIQCLSEKKIQADLAKSRSILNNTTVFCYPFYEYNDYSISQLKKAGFTMAFARGSRKATPGINKYKIPRYVIVNTTGVDYLKKII